MSRGRERSFEVIKNIRSYKDEIIEFPKKSILLSGDIGSGKSSILLSIEFALFGFRRDDLSGSMLLRHGKKEGSVELNFDINDKNIIIKRFLKRTNYNIKQDKNYIIINDEKQDMTPIELKSKILEILGYPKDLLTKSKESIFRYTVYTPQGARKNIIFANTQERLDILRKVFGIDKYKRIRENLIIYNREIKKKINYLLGQIEDIDSLAKEKDELKKNQELIIKNSKKIFDDEKKLKFELDDAIEKIKKFEDINNLFEKKKNEDKIVSLKIDQINNSNEENNEKIDILKRKIIDEKKLLDDKKIISLDKLNNFLNDINKKIYDTTNKKLEFSKKIAILKSKNDESNDLVEKIVSLNNCPTCKQEVCNDHKNSIKKEMNDSIKDNKEKLEKLEKLLEKINNNLIILDNKKNDVNKKINESKEIEIREKIIVDNETEQNDMIKIIKENNIKIIDYKKEKDILKEEITKLEKDLIDYKLEKEEYEKINEEHKLILQKSSSIKQKIDGLKNQILMLDKRINIKLDSKKKYERLNSLLSILENSGLPLVGIIEKQVMGSIHYEFNQILSKWFNSLIGEEMLQLRLDAEFNPIIEQNGYETTIDNLSGGEKTAVALSYRLALNRVINDLISNIMTKDLLILDEPTEGFSAEQLDRLNDVFYELGAKQLIIVSHDNKIESFVEHHIRIEKNEHESFVN